MIAAKPGERRYPALMDAAGTRILEIPRPDGLTVRVEAYFPRNGQAAGIVVLCHGFKGHRRWGFLPELCSRLREAGLAALSMDFSRNGYGGDGNRTSEEGRFDPEIFRTNTISRELDDLREVVRYISEKGLSGGAPNSLPVGLYGHSRGAISVILHAVETKNCEAICTWATTSDPNFFSDNQKEVWRRKGFYEFTDSRTGLSLALDIAYLEDLEENAARFRLAERVPRLTVPHLLVHGTLDLVVPSKCSEEIYRAETAMRDKHLILLKTGHTFGFGRDHRGPSPEFETAARETVLWFRKYLTTGDGTNEKMADHRK